MRVQNDYNLTSYPTVFDPSYQLYWFTLTVKLGDGPSPAIAAYTARTGQWRYLAPIYQALIDSGHSKTAHEYYNNNKFNYPPQTRDRLLRIIGATSVTKHETDKKQKRHDSNKQNVKFDL